jgi:hypothetical protein
MPPQGDRGGLTKIEKKSAYWSQVRKKQKFSCIE